MTAFTDLIGVKSAEWFDKWTTLHTRLTSVTDAIEAALFGVGATSGTNVTPATGAQAFVLNSAKSLKAGMYRIESQAAPTTKYMVAELAADLAAGTAFDVTVQIAAGGAAADWVIYPLGGLLAALIPAQSKAALYTVQKSDRTATILCSGTFAVTLDQISTLGIGFRVTLANESGAITVQRAGSDTVEGLSAIVLAPKQRVTLEAVSSSAWIVVAAKGYGASIGKALALSLALNR